MIAIISLAAVNSIMLLILSIANLVSFKELGDDFGVLFEGAGLVFLRDLVKRREVRQQLASLAAASRAITTCNRRRSLRSIMMLLGIANDN